MIRESESWNAGSLYTTAMEDASVAPLVSIIANHNNSPMPQRWEPVREGT